MAAALRGRVFAGQLALRASVLVPRRFLGDPLLVARPHLQRTPPLRGRQRRGFCDAAVAGSSASYEDALGSFRRHASAEVTAVAEGGNADSLRLTMELRTVLEAELGATFAESTFAEVERAALEEQAAEAEPAEAQKQRSCGSAQPGGEPPVGVAERSSANDAAALLGQELGEALAKVAAVSELRQEHKQLRTRRADLLAVGYQDQVGENQEYAALAVCAIAGIFAVSISYVFFIAWGLSYFLYRRATVKLRAKHEATAKLQDTLDRIREVDEEVSQYRADLHTLAMAWQTGDRASIDGVKAD